MTGVDASAAPKFRAAIFCIVPSRFNIPVLAAVVTVRVVDPVADKLAGENAHLASAGKPEQLNVTAPVKPSRSVIEIVIVPELPGRWIGNAVVEGSIEKSGWILIDAGPELEAM